MWPDHPARASVCFKAEDNGYARTSLVGLEFTYVTMSEPDQATCLKQVTDYARQVQPNTAFIHRTAFHHISTADAGLGHGWNREIDETYRNGQCYLFEGTFEAIYTQPYEGHRPLTRGESDALIGRLKAIMQTVKILPVK